MTVTFGTMLNQMTGLFVLLVIGYCLNRLGILPPEAETVLSKISAKLFLPSLMLYTFMKECTVENLIAHNSLMFYGAAFQLASIFIAVLLARPLAKGQPFLTGVYRYALSFPNTGGFGNPTVLALFGHAGLFQYQLYLLLNLVFCYSWGVPQMIPTHHGGGWRESLKTLFNPVLVGIMLGAFLGLTGLSRCIPGAIHTTIENLGNSFAIVSLILTGFVIANYPVTEILHEKKNYFIAFLRLILIPGVFLLVLRLLRLPDMLCILTCLAYACPCGMNTVVYPAAYGQDTRPGAGLTLLTSAAAVITIPLLMAVML